MNLEKFIVTTTIFKPSLAVKKFSKFQDWKLIVVGDLKTPHRMYENLKKYNLFISQGPRKNR